MDKQKIEALRLHFIQPTAHYRVGFTQNNLHRTHPLPPPSTVLGMIHNLMGCKKGQSIKGIDIAVAGRYESIYYQYQLLRNLYKTDTGMKPAYKEVSKGTPMPVQVQLLYNVELYIYIKACLKGKYLNNGEEKDFDEIIEAFRNPRMPFILGRREDIAILHEEPQVITIGKGKLPPGGFKNFSTWADLNNKYGFKGHVSLLNTYYELAGKKGSEIRNFNRKRYIYTQPQDVELNFDRDSEIVNINELIPDILLDKISISNGNTEKDKEIFIPIMFLLEDEEAQAKAGEIKDAGI